MSLSRLLFEHWQIQLRPTCPRYSRSPDFGQKIFLSCYRDQLRPRTRRAVIAFLRATPLFAKCAMINIRAVLLEDHPQIYCGMSILAILALSSTNMRNATAFKVVQVLFNFIETRFYKKGCHQNLYAADLACRGHLGHTPRITFRFGSRAPIPPRLSSNFSGYGYNFIRAGTGISLDAGLRDVYNLLPSNEHTLRLPKIFLCSSFDFLLNSR
ncbi:hypothetical protein C8R44DRAFT_862789 [Mycena epipterygia]|nr:hypothetical protein C8R44DRAFT_862789 [Mycena epipterygia]